MKRFAIKDNGFQLLAIFAKRSIFDVSQGSEYDYVIPLKAVVQRCFVKKVFLEIPQISQENTCARVSFLIKFQASATSLKKRP